VLPPRRSRRIAGRPNAAFDDLGVDVFMKIYEFLGPIDIMPSRLNNKMREAAKNTIFSPTDFYVNSVVKYNAMAAMTRALPNLQQTKLGSLLYLDRGHKYVDGEDPDEDGAAITANDIAHEIDIISNFSKLRRLELFDAPLNGRYPVLFNFPVLHLLAISHYDYLKWDLEMLEGLPSLKELYCDSNDNLTGNINSLRVLKDTLAKVSIIYCPNVEGDFMDLADFPYLTKLHLIETAVTGDIREVGDQDFSALIDLYLPYTVYGGRGHEFQRISDTYDVISTIYSIKKQRPTVLKGWYGKLSGDSTDWYNGSIDDEDTPPLFIAFVQAGSRVGYRWETENGDPCEVDWLDPEPGKESSDYEQYVEELHEIEQPVDMYRGFHQPPTEEEYYRLWEERED
jgi:hypothetical protein